MQLFKIVFERLPMVWFLLGLLFNALGLYVGFGEGLSFLFFGIGLFCCAYAVTIFVLQHVQKPARSAATRLSPQFISAGSSADIPPPARIEEPEPAGAPRSERPPESAQA